MDKFRNCYWCGKKIESKTFFCSEKCRHEYNTAKGTKQEMFDLEYEKYEAQGQTLTVKLALLFFLGLLIALTMHYLVGYGNDKFWNTVYGVFIGVVVITLWIRLFRASARDK